MQYRTNEDCHDSLMTQILGLIGGGTMVAASAG
jgi:hypothetical protein